MSVPPDDALRSAEVNEVIRYWLAALRFEEALASRPRAHRLDPRRPPAVDLAEPRGGQPYFKLRGSGDGAAFLTGSITAVDLPLDAERTAFFVRWLRRAYMRERSPFTGWDGDPGTVVVGFPVVYFPRTEELAGLLRFRARLIWRDARSGRFEPPAWKDRQRGRLPEPPVRVEVVAIPDEDELLPFSLDTQLLVRTLGVTDEEIGDLTAGLRARGSVSPTAMIRALVRLLSKPPGQPPTDGPDPAGDEAPGEADSDGRPQPGVPVDEAEPDDGLDADARLAQLVQAVRGRLGRRARGPAVYGVGLVNDGDQIFATRHLQRELAHLTQRRIGAPPWGRRSPLWGYLSGAAAPSAWAPMWGLHRPRPLTADQRLVAERFLASPLTAAQGPPGTGKTELLLALSAAALVQRVEGLRGRGEMPRRLTLVCSTNNRAVDHVLEPLSEVEEGPPLGLRTGNQQVLATVAADLFDRSLGWLDQQPARTDAERKQRYEAAFAAYETARAALEAAEAPRLAGREARRRARTLADRIATREHALADLGSGADEPAPPAGARADLDRRLRALRERVRQMQTIFSRGGAEPVIRAMNVWQRARGRVFKRLVNALSQLDAPIELEADLPPEVEPGAEEEVHVEAWEDALVALDDALVAIKARLDARQDAAEHRAALERLRDEQALLPPVIDAEPADAELHYGVYRAALAVRAAWADRHREALVPALTTAREWAETRRPIRRLLDDEVDAADWLMRLYPVWGSTLLSLGNVLPALPRTGLRLIIDEAGQCHPAYAVSGLMRAEQALVIGDVHQLEPVVQLGREDEARVRAAAAIRLPFERLSPYRVTEYVTTSAQGLADRAVDDRPTLRAHFRCQPEIIALSDTLCDYGLEVRTPLPEGPSPLPGALVFAQTRGTQVRVRGSWHNPQELERVMQVLDGLARRGVPWGEIAVITPYVGQLEALLGACRRRRLPLERVAEEVELDLFGNQGGLAVGTVHRFQGGERRVVIFSTVVTRTRSLGFLNQRVNLVNVAVSRAREHLVVIGDPDTLRAGRYTRLLVERAVPLVAPTSR